MTFPAGGSPLLERMLQVRQAMNARDAAILNRLLRDYLASYNNLKASILALQEAVEAAGPGSLARLAALQSLLDGVKREIARFAEILAENIEQAIQLEIEMAGIDTLALTQAMLPGLETARLIADWARLDKRTVYNLYGFLDPDGPLFAMIRNQFADDVARMVRQQLLSGFVEGMHSNEIARIMAKALGVGLDWALTMARTAVIWSYRVSTHQMYLANSKYIKGWYWISALDRRTCMSCIALHGSFHSLAEIQNDHHRGRCFSVPDTVSYADLGLVGIEEFQPHIPAGEEWFKKQTDALQREMMGPAKWKAWQDGAFEFDQLTKTYTNPIYGPMKREATLHEILGDKANIYYGK